MTRLFKKLDITGVAVLLLAFFVAVGFTATSNMQPTWYEVTIADEEEDHDDPNNQEIGDALTGNPTGSCNPAYTQTICAIQLTLGPGVDKPSTVQEAEDMAEDEDEELTIHERAFKLN